MQLNYSEHLGKLIEQVPVGVPIFTDKVAKTMAQELGVPVIEVKDIVNLNLKRLADKRVIERVQKGVYYKSKMTVFGKTPPPMELVVHELCTREDDQRIGYVGAESYLHQLGLCTLMPKQKVIVTNKHRTKVAAMTQTVLKKPATTITTENYRYLQMIDVITTLETSYVDALNPKAIIEDAIQSYHMDKITLLKIAKKHYPQKALLQVLDIVLEDTHEFAH